MRNHHDHQLQQQQQRIARELIRQQQQQQQKQCSARDVIEGSLNPQTGKYHCPKCRIRSFSQSYSMFRHFKYECADALPRYQCPYCGHVSKWTHSIYNHVRKLHPGQVVTLNKLYWEDVFFFFLMIINAVLRLLFFYHHNSIDFSFV